ncbi:SLC13 family permease [Sphingorhabdus arenilitoris]|uniref:SLC13 family permease n=1 Tax=Sphingorhabdus arenilitoris TaxID=1490041 RepID=A0ABV8RDU0_9SPHN
MTAERIGFWAGLILFAAMLMLPAPGGMTTQAWQVAALVLLMAVFWMTQALPLTVTALLPFLALPAMGVMSASDTAKEYYSPILFLILGGAFIALAIERTGLHRRVALAILKRAGNGAAGLLFAFMIATALLSMLISNTSTALIMVPIALAVLAAGGVKDGETDGMAGALMMGIAFAASIGGLGTLVGSPTNAIAAGLINKQLGIEINFLSWMAFGLPVVLLSIPVCGLILMRVQKMAAIPFRAAAAREAIGTPGPWSMAEKRLVPVIALVVLLWIMQPWLKDIMPEKSVTDGSIAILGSLLLFTIPDGSGRPLLVWKEADRAPWGVIMMFGGGLALAAGITQSGLAAWLGEALEPLSAVHPLIIAACVVALVIVITEFASNVATASGVIPVIAGLAAATGADPWMLAMAASMAASWGFMLPSGTGPNAIAWASGHIALPRMLKAGFLLDLAGVPILIAICWIVAGT